MHKHIAAALLIVLAVLSPSRAWAQGVTISFQPDRSDLPACAGETLEVIVGISNPSRVDVGGYQAFLRYPAKYLSPVRFEPGAINAFVETGGPIPFGAGYRACNAQVIDGWGDGAGDDIVAVAATAFAADADDPFREASGELGRFIFRPTGETPPGPILFASNLQACHLPLDQTTKAFGPDGRSLAEGSTSSFSVTLAEAGPAVRDLACIDQTGSVVLRWMSPPLNEFGGFKIYRNADVIAMINVNFLTSYEDTSPIAGSATYRVALLLRNGDEGCGVMCTMDRSARFERGDANRDGRFNVSDPIATLDHLFRSGVLTCLDAADFDDNGANNITDAVAMLRQLFEPGDKPPVPPPFASEGLDPTEDDLTCDA